MESNSAGSDLIHAARDGDELAINALLDHYRNYLKLLAHAQMDRRLRVRVSPSDLAQEALLDAFRQFRTFRGSQTVELVAWLRTILARRLADKFRFHQAAKRDMRRERALEEALHQSSIAVERALVSAQPSATSKAIQSERVVELADALDRLPTDYREIIVLREIEKLSFEDVAAQMKRTSGAVRMLWVRALERLRKEMGARS